MQPIFEVTNCAITSKFFEQCLVGVNIPRTRNYQYELQPRSWWCLDDLEGSHWSKEAFHDHVTSKKKIMPHSRARRRTVIKEADPANQEAAWDHCYVAGGKWWTRL